MAKQKVYLSKSNASDPDELMLVRKHLAKYDVEVVEFRGGNYSHAPMLECDVLLVLPPKNGLTPFGTVNVGKGQFEQINTWRRVPSLMITGLSESKILVQPIEAYKLHASKDQNWQDYWGSIELMDLYLEFKQECTEDLNSNYNPITTKYPEFIKDEDSVVPMLACITLIK